MCLIDCDEVCRRKKLHICHAEFLEVVDTCCKTIRVLCSLLSKRKIFTFVADTRCLMNREVTMMHLINDDVRRLDLRALILCPAFRIGLCPINDSTSPAVDSHCLRSDTCSLLQPLSFMLYLESIECTFEVLLHGCFPQTAFTKLHIHSCKRKCIRSRIIQLDPGCFSRRRPYGKLRLITIVDTLFKRSLRNRIDAALCTRSGHHQSHCRHKYQF